MFIVYPEDYLARNLPPVTGCPSYPQESPHQAAAASSTGEHPDDGAELAAQTP